MYDNSISVDVTRLGKNIYFIPEGKIMHIALLIVQYKGGN